MILLISCISLSISLTSLIICITLSLKVESVFRDLEEYLGNNWQDEDERIM